jgi:hypothetical protein
VAAGRITGGEIIGSTANGFFVEKRRCPQCGVGVERAALDYWHVAGSLGADEPLESRYIAVRFYQ